MSSQALADWNAASVEERSTSLAILHQHAEAMCAAQVKASAGVSCLVLAPPVLEVTFGERVDGGAMSLRWTLHWRLSHLAQSGSDWGEQYVAMLEGIVSQGKLTRHRVVAERTLPVTEIEEATYDDHARAAEALAALALKKTLAWAFLMSTQRETYATTTTDPVGIFLQRAGMFRHDVYDEIPYTDWNGAVVGGETGSLRRRGIPADPTLAWSELAVLLEHGMDGRCLVARHPSTPLDVLMRLARDEDQYVQRALTDRSDLDPSLLEVLATSAFPSVREAVARLRTRGE